MRVIFAALFAMVIGAVVTPVSAALPPEAYEQLRNTAPLAFSGVVQQDRGGQALVRVEHVARGMLRIGQMITVVYPVATGYAPPGPQVHYRTFIVGSRLRVFAQPSYDGRSVHIVHGGIDIMTPPPKPKGGCAACSVGASDTSDLPMLASLAVLGMAFVRRRRRRSRRHRGLLAPLALAGALVWACSPAGPQPPPAGSAAPAPTPAPDDGVEIATDGKSTVTVLGRPDHPSVKPPPGTKPANKTDSECRMQQACATQGLCTAKATSCVAVSYDDCAQMRGSGTGKCQFNAGVCSVVASCKDAFACSREGTCVDAADGCTADADACKQAQVCTQAGRCSVSDGICVASTDEECKSAALCQNEGRCTVDAGRCIAKDDKACKASPACTNEERCLARDGVCVKSCADGELCVKHGRCGERPKMPGSCVALSDTDCDKSAVCKDLGHCSLGLDARCVAGDDVECRLSRTCKEDGRCTQKHGRCVPNSDAECQAATVACKREGRCKHAAGSCVKG